jgi:pilus assembly protein CpaF
MPQPFIVQHRAATVSMPVERPPISIVLPESLAIPRRPPSDVSAVSRPTPPRASYRDDPAIEPITAYLDDPEVTDVFVNGATGLFVDRGQGAARVAASGARRRADRHRRSPCR